MMIRIDPLTYVDDIINASNNSLTVNDLKIQLQDEFRVRLEFPDTTGVGDCALAAGNAWRSMTDSENAPYFAMADRGAMYRPPWAGPCNCNDCDPSNYQKILPGSSNLLGHTVRIMQPFGPRVGPLLKSSTDRIIGCATPLFNF
ncbi:unnamed protein product [Brassica oleracea]